MLFMEKIYVCPKCGFNKWKVPYNSMFGDNNTKECEKCGFIGIFFLKEEIGKPGKGCKK